MSYIKQLQALIEEYRREVQDGPLQLADIAAWAIRSGKWKPSMKEEMSLLSKDLGAAMRTQFESDPDGRRIRRKHVVRYKETREDGAKIQLNLWYDKDIAPPNFMYESFQQRRGGATDVLWQLKQDVDSYNKFINKAAPVQIIFDFTEDMEEREAGGDYGSPDDPSDDDF